MKKILSNKYLVYSLFALGGLFLGWLFFHSSKTTNHKDTQVVQEAKATIWTCSMHPHIRMDAPGKCPICAMDLIPLNQSTVDIDADAIHLTKDAAALANVLTSVVSKQAPVKEIRLYGKIQADERLLQSQVAHISGRIEKLMVNFTGEGIQKGQTLATIYSPELVTAQQELLESAKTKQSQPEIYEAAKGKLRQWKFTESQIANIESSGTVLNDLELVSNTTGIVTAKRVNNGDYVSQGTILFEIADLSKVWVMLDAYESDLPLLNIGDIVSFNVQAMPGKSFSGKIIYIDPVIDPTTRVSKVRIEISNQSGKLKPEMFVTGFVNANLSEYQGKMIIPSSSVLWTGKRSIVYVKQPDTDEPIFKLREITIGPMLGNSYVVIDGLTEGEEIVTQGTFSVDAAAQLEGKSSMMNSDGEKMSIGHDHGNTQPNAKMDNSTEHSGHTANQMAKHEMFNVSGSCEMCKERIETAAKSVKGVTSAVWDDKTKQIHVEFNGKETDLDAIQKAIAKVGHDTEKYKASNDIYNALPDCCKYR